MLCFLFNSLFFWYLSFIWKMLWLIPGKCIHILSQQKKIVILCVCVGGGWNESQAFNNNTQRPARNPDIQAPNPNTPNSIPPLPSVSNRFGSADDDVSIQSVVVFVLFYISSIPVAIVLANNASQKLHQRPQLTSVLISVLLICLCFVNSNQRVYTASVRFGSIRID